MKRFVSSQLNVNTLIGGCTLAVMLFLGKTIMSDHDSTVIHTEQLNSMEIDVMQIKSALPNYALKAEMEASQRAIWNELRVSNPSHRGAQP